MRSSPDREHWFRAKPYGWGYASPTCWQGWAVLGVFLVLVVAAVVPICVIGGLGIGWWLIFVGIMTLALFVFIVCGRKGPRLRWRSGEKDTGDYPPGHCQGCGYDLTGNLSGACPECGRAFTGDELARK